MAGINWIVVLGLIGALVVIFFVNKGNKQKGK